MSSRWPRASIRDEDADTIAADQSDSDDAGNTQKSPDIPVPSAQSGRPVASSLLVDDMV